MVDLHLFLGHKLVGELDDYGQRQHQMVHQMVHQPDELLGDGGDFKRSLNAPDVVLDTSTLKVGGGDFFRCVVGELLLFVRMYFY